MPEQFIRVNRYVVSRSLSDGPGGDLTLRMTLFPHPDDEAPVDEALLWACCSSFRRRELPEREAAR